MRRLLVRQAQCALPRLVIDQQQKVNLLEGAGCSALAFRAAQFHSAHKSTPPPVRRRVTDGPEHRHICWRVKRGRGPAAAPALARTARDAEASPSSYSEVALSLFLPTWARSRPIRLGTPSRSTYTRVSLSITLTSRASALCESVAAAVFPQVGDRQGRFSDQ